MRMTYKAQDQNGKETGTVWYASTTGDSIFPKSAKEEQALKKLATYEDAEEQGRLVVLPCNVGDKLYEIDMKEYGVIVCEALWYTVGKNKYTGETDWSVNVHVVEGHGKGSGYYFTPDDFGKIVFLTRTEAESALRRRADNGQ